MAYKAKFLHFKTKQSYNAERNKTSEGTDERKVFDAYISFIDEGPTICTWGKEYKCEVTLEDIESIINSKGFITINDIPTSPSPSSLEPLEPNIIPIVGTSTKYAREDHAHPAQTTITGNAGTATKLQQPVNISLTGAVAGAAYFDGSKDISINTTFENIDASKITSGILDENRLPNIPLEKLPAGALERLVIVADQSARYKLTIEDVQEGDTVKQEDTGTLYFVVDNNNLSNENGYKVYTAGAATSVPWSGITDKPDFHPVATSGNYNELNGLPDVPYIINIPEKILIWETSVDSSTINDSFSEVGSDVNDIMDTFFVKSSYNKLLFAVCGRSGSSNGNNYSVNAEGIYTASNNRSIKFIINDYSNKVRHYVTLNVANRTPSISESRIEEILTEIPSATSSKLGGIKTGYTNGEDTAVPVWTDSSDNGYVKLTALSIESALNGNYSGTSEIAKKVENTLTFTGAATGSYDGSSNLTINIPEGSKIPETLPNPYPIKFMGAVTTSYDGSSEVTVNIPEGGGDIPATLPNPYPINFTGSVTESYDGSSELTVNIPSALTYHEYPYNNASIGSSTVNGITPGVVEYPSSWSNTSSSTFTIYVRANAFSSDTPDAVVIVKGTRQVNFSFTSTNGWLVKQSGILTTGSASNTYRVYAFSYLGGSGSNTRVAVNCSEYSE